MTTSKAAVHWTEKGIKIWAVQRSKTGHVNLHRLLFTKTMHTESCTIENWLCTIYVKESCTIEKLYWLCNIYVKAVSLKTILATPNQDLAYWKLYLWKVLLAMYHLCKSCVCKNYTVSWHTESCTIENHCWLCTIYVKAVSVKTILSIDILKAVPLKTIAGYVPSM